MVVLPDYKDIVKLIKKGMVLEAQEAIMTLRQAALDSSKEVLELREQVKALNIAADLSDRIVWERPFYWLTRGGQERDGPFCQRCWDVDKKPIRLQHHGGDDHFICKECKRDYPVLGKSGGKVGALTWGGSFEP